MSKKLLGMCILFWLVFGCSPKEEPNKEEVIEPAEYLDCYVVSDTEIAFTFTAPVKIQSLSIYPYLETRQIEEGSVVKVQFAQRFKPRSEFTADIVAEDERGNTIEAQAIFERDEPLPVLLACDVVSETEIEYTFSMSVRIVSLSFEPALEIDSIEEGSTVRVHLEKSFKRGIQYMADIVAEDEWGDYINETIPFETDAPELLFLGFRAVSENSIDFEYSVPVRVVSLSFNPVMGISSIRTGSTVRVYLDENLNPGQRIEADILAEDEFGQTVSEKVIFRAKNNRVPQLLINELRTEYAGSSSRAEFIEFKMLTGGNLGALRVFAVSNSKTPMIYEFQPVEVEAGEYVVLHLRALEDLCVDEYGDDLAESGGVDSSPTARDFWIPGSTKLLRKTDAVYVLDQDDRVLDAVMISETPDPQWNKDYFAEAAEFLFSQGAWKSPLGTMCAPADAVNSANIKTSVTRSISRDETEPNTNTAADWYVTANSGATPGLPNNPARFQ